MMPPRPSAEEARPAGAPASLKVLIVEDNTFDAELIVRRLRAVGFAFTSTLAQTETDFLAALEAGPDVILADWHLPAFGAQRALELLAARASTVPLIVVSGSIDHERAQHAVRLGAQGYLVKDELGSIGVSVAAALERGRLRVSAANAAREASAATQALAEREAMLRATFDQAAVGIAHISPDLQIMRANPKLADLFGWPLESLIGKRIQDLSHPEDREVMTVLRERLYTGESASIAADKRFLRADGNPVWIRVTISLARDSAGEPEYEIAIFEDIGERKRAEEHLERLANFDTLTGLPNRSLFRDRLEQAIAQARRNNRQVGLLFIDLDQFKLINDSLGHAVGDQLLGEVGARLQNCLRAGDTAARLGGDEFATLLPDLHSSKASGVVAQKIIDALKVPFEIDGRELFVGASIGITVFPADSTDASTMLRNADVALFRAKDAGRNRFQFFTQRMNEDAARRHRFEGDLRRALGRREFELHFQPKIDLRDAGVTGVEALLRWRPASGELVSPAEFVPVLEDAGLIVEVGDWVIQEACRRIISWRGRVPERMSVAVNVSTHQFRGGQLQHSIARALAATGCAPERLQIEITESMMMDDFAGTRETLLALRTLGVRVAVDDFGTGYSSLAYLRRLPLDILKIDRSFVRELSRDPNNAAIPIAIINMAHALGHRVVAEGVETTEQRDLLAAQGCDEIQGFLISRALPEAELLDWLSAQG